MFTRRSALMSFGALGVTNTVRDAEEYPLAFES